ncbi:immunity protein [Pectobacterium jejuense]|uniref:immunity protein n=1 Tax=Pectobacterium jejuense TaxID=2974022 RepID=UPI0022821205|nr:immunity protein [Pectobacterium jejuense]MCY9847400.1 immunity protein [Pectobacterium jejuense]
MANMKEVIQNETLEDVLTVFALTSDYKQLDRLYTYTNFDVISSGELSAKYNELFHKGILEDKNGTVVKGPNWVAPKFVTDKKYGF